MFKRQANWQVELLREEDLNLRLQGCETEGQSSMPAE